ncbi:hypothetical protein TNCV_1002501 [Trichonephila clavipes]|nr:hypothetical protein TNCV_1002501 [Trichonephila clavipes]
MDFGNGPRNFKSRLGDKKTSALAPPSSNFPITQMGRRLSPSTRQVFSSTRFELALRVAFNPLTGFARTPYGLRKVDCCLSRSKIDE